ncbi:MAG: class I SAM-dependent methyltransferase [Bacteriovoracaceae bacterium]
MNTKNKPVPDHTAVRVALWRALHVEIDAAPYVFEDMLGAKIAAPDKDWRQRPDMHPEGTKGYRASIVGRARFIEDLLSEKVRSGLDQYVILGAGLDTFAQRRKDLTSKLYVFEIDEPHTQEWKRKRLAELNYGVPDFLKLVPVDFESGESWIEKLSATGFNNKRPAFIASTGVSLYLSREANLDTFKKIATLTPGSIFAMTFMLPPALVEESERPQYEMVMQRAAASGTPFIGLYRPEEIMNLAREAGLKNIVHVSRADIIDKYFKGRSDNLVPASGEEFLVVTV